MGLAACSQPLAPPELYRPRNVRATPLYQFLEAYYEDVKAIWEERFQKKYGFWRGFVDQVVARYVDCGVEEAGFARLKCDTCGAEKLLTLSCKQRGLCPSCDAKRAAAFATFLKDELLENVGHCLWTFTLPKMLRPFFMRRRALLSDLARLAYETVEQLLCEAAGDENARAGVVGVPQTFGSLLQPHPHVHCLASRGLWNTDGQWIPVPYIDANAAEKLFRFKILRFLKRKGLLDDERIELLNSFPNSGFSVDTSPTVWPQDSDGLERLGRYMLRAPLSLSRIHWSDGARTLFYQAKATNDDSPSLFRHPDGETLEVFEFIARVLTQIPEPRKHNVHYYGAYASRSRALRKKRGLHLEPTSRNRADATTDEPELTSKHRAALRKRWANLIRRVHKTDPLLCSCGGRFRILAFITEPKLIARIFEHLDKRNTRSRASPQDNHRAPSGSSS